MRYPTYVWYWFWMKLNSSLMRSQVSAMPILSEPPGTPCVKENVIECKVQCFWEIYEVKEVKWHTLHFHHSKVAFQFFFCKRNNFVVFDIKGMKTSFTSQLSTINIEKYFCSFSYENYGFKLSMNSYISKWCAFFDFHIS